MTLIQQGKVRCLILPREDAGAYKVGESYPVQSWRPREGGGAPVVSEEKLRVRVAALEKTTLDYELRGEVIEQAGYEDADALWEHWRHRYQTGPLAGPDITVVHFELDPVERERYLRAAGGYTTSPNMALRTEASGEPVAPDLEIERAVPPGAQREQTRRAKQVWAETASMRRSLRDAAARRRVEPSPLEGLTGEDREVVLDLCAALREAQQLDRSRQVAAIRRRIEAIRNKARKDRAA